MVKITEKTFGMRILCLMLYLMMAISCKKQDAEERNISMDLSDFTLSVDKAGYEVNGKFITMEMKFYSGELVVWDQKIDVSFISDAVDIELANFIAILSAQVNWIAENRPVIEDKIVSELLELKNSTWLRNGEKPLSRRKFLSAITPTNITFYPQEGNCEMSFECGDLFWGHWIIVWISKDRQIEGVGIEG